MLSFYLAALETDEERTSFEEIYHMYKHTCLSVALNILGSQALAEEAVSKTFLSLIVKKEKYLSQSCGKLKNQIVLIVRNKAIDILRCENRYVHEIPGEEDEGFFSAIKDDFNLENYVMDADSAERLVNIVLTLPEIYRTAFQMRYSESLSNNEISELLGITAKAASMRIARAKIIIQERLQKESEFNE